MLSVIMLNVVMLSVIMLNVVILSAVAPSEHPIKVRVNVVQTLGAVIKTPYFLRNL
jgi:hypothetical protein